MYTRYLGLQEKPFAIAPDPRYLFMSDLHREALAHLLYGINSDGCIILLTGDVGTGKTTVCRSLFSQLPKTTDTAIILNPKLTAKELLVTICDELELTDKIKGNSTKAYLDAINHHLLKAHSKGRTTAIIIDEAQNLNFGVLEQLRLLTNLETDKQKLLKIVLLGQPELRKALERPEASQINQRITSRYHLLPLAQEDVKTYIRHRMEIAGGGKSDFFTNGAIKRVYQLTQGIPRLINVICDRALLGAYAQDKRMVTTKMLNRAATEVLGESGYKKAKNNIPFTLFTRRTYFAISLVCLLALSISFAIARDYYPDFKSFFGLHTTQIELEEAKKKTKNGITELKSKVSLKNKTTQTEEVKTQQDTETDHEGNTPQEAIIYITPMEVK
jgi:general secretion pathway protein A